MSSKRERRKIPLPRLAPPDGEVNIAFAVRIPGEFRMEYVGPLEEESARQIMQILAKRIFLPADAVGPAEPSAKTA